MIFLFLYRLIFPLLLIAEAIVLLPYNYSKDNFYRNAERIANNSTDRDTLIIPDESRPTMPPETDVLTIPLKSAGRLFMIEAIIDNQSGNLIFDSGATGLVMNRTYFFRDNRTGWRDREDKYRQDDYIRDVIF
jgi:hypothetical protein